MTDIKIKATELPCATETAQWDKLSDEALANMELTDEEKDKLIVLALGECCHEWEFWSATRLCSDKSDERCKKCGVWKSELLFDDLGTPDGFFWILPRLKKMPWRIGLWAFLWWKATHSNLDFNYNALPTIYLNPPIFRDALAEFLEGRE